MRKSARVRAGVALVGVLSIAAAACGDDDSKSSSSTTAAAGSSSSAATTAASSTTAAAGGGSSTTAAGGGSSTTAAAGGGGSQPSGSTWCADPIDSSIDKVNGTNAGWTVWVLKCAEKSPLKATGDPISMGAITPEGDPAGTFPEWQAGAKAAVEYINNELGGIGADYKAGKPGRPLKIDFCTTAINPADVTKCANDIASKKPFAVLRNINFFGNDIPIYQTNKIPIVSASLVTAADFTAQGQIGIATGAGCLGQHTALVDFVTKDLGKKRIAVPWADTPPGVFCYNDLEKKPLRVLAGKVDADASVKGTIPGLEDIGVPIKPATPDITAQVQQVLDFKPDGIIFSAQSADCWNVVNTLGKLGWTPDKIPLVMSGACVDDAKALAAGDLAKGIYFVGASPQRSDQSDPTLGYEGKVMADKIGKYGNKDVATKAFGINGFNSTIVTMQLMDQTILKNGGTPDKLTAENFLAYGGATTFEHAFNGTPLNCAGAPAPYTAACSPYSNVTQWNGDKYITKRANVNGVYLLKGTKLDTGQ